MGGSDEQPGAEEREVERMLRERRPLWAFAEAAAGGIGFVTLAISLPFGLSLGIALAGVLLSTSGVAGLAYGGVPLLQVRVLISRAWTIRFATVSRAFVIPLGIALAIAGFVALVR